MALDGITLHLICTEIEQLALDSRIEKIYQPSRDEVVIGLRGKNGTYKLLINAGANSPRLHFTQVGLENPKAPPMFCMLLRKYLGSGRLVAIRQLELDRVVFLDFETVNEFSDKVIVTICVEIMGRHSNLILLDQTGKIIDAIKRIDAEISSVRFVLPGVTYQSPPSQGKTNLITTDTDQAIALIKSQREQPLDKSLMACFMGLSAIVCRELSYYTTHGREVLNTQLDVNTEDRLRFTLNNLKQSVITRSYLPTMVLTPDQKPKDFSYLSIHQYEHAMITREFDSFSMLLDSFYSERDRVERIRQRSGDLLKLLINATERIERKLALQKQELVDCENRETLKQYGDLIHANAYTIQKGQTKAEVVNFYDENGVMVEIPLDPALSPAQNAQRYYSEYRKADTAQKMLIQLVKSGQDELAYLESVFDALTRASTETELLAIREELITGKYIRNTSKSKQKPAKLSFIRYCSDDGFTILAGRNNMQNDQLTLKQADKSDMWFHTHNIPGSHVVVLAEGKKIPDTTLNQAAILAALHSKARESSQVPVDYTLIKNIKKPTGAKPGMVIYDTYQTAFVTPDGELEQRLLKKD